MTSHRLLDRATDAAFFIVIAMIVVLLVMALDARSAACAHDQWADGSSVPPWVKSACCGAADAHLLAPGDYWIDKQGFHIRAIDRFVDIDQVQPSQDGQVWAFYKAGTNGVTIYCVFYSGAI